MVYFGASMPSSGPRTISTSYSCLLVQYSIFVSRCITGIYFMWQKWQLEETAADIEKCVICNALGKMYLVRMQCSCIAEE